MKCCYVLSAAGVHPATHCGKPTRWKVGIDEDGNNRRHYDYLCPEHRAVVDTRLNDNEGDEDDEQPHAV